MRIVRPRRWWATAGAVVVALGVVTIGAQEADEGDRGTAPAPHHDRAAVDAATVLPGPIRAKLENLRKQAPDEPAAAARYQALRRGTRGVDPIAAYARARERMAGMRRYSSASGRFVPEGYRAASAAAAAWSWLGPGNVGGRTRALAIHPRKPRIMYAGGVSGGVWKSTNGGRRWKPVADDLASIAVNSLALDPSNPKVIYAGTGEGYFREEVRGTGLPLRGAGIFRSRNAGRSWERLPGTAGRDFWWVNDLVVSATDPERIYAATRRGVFRTVDGGASWTRVLPTRARGGCLDLAELPGGPGDDLLASCGTLAPATIYRKLGAEGGGRWQPVHTEPGMGRTSLAVAPSDPSVVYALSASNVPGPGGNFEQALHAVFRSDVRGASGSWEARLRNSDPRKQNTLLLSNPVVAMLVECGFEGANEYFAMGWYVNVIAVDPLDPDRVWAAGVDLFRSDDGGRNWGAATYWWNDETANHVHADHHGLVFHPRRPATLYSLNDGGVWRTDNAAAPVSMADDAICEPGSSSVAWRHLNSNFGVTQFYHGTAFPDGRTYLAGAQDNGTVLGDDRFGANGWVDVLGGDGGYTAVNPENPDLVYASIQNGLVFRSTSGGFAFQEATSGIVDLAGNDSSGFTAVGPAFLFIAPLALDALDPAVLWLGGRRMWRTTDGANLWRPASAPFGGGAKASAVAIDPTDSDRVIAGTQRGFVLRTDRGLAAADDTVWQRSQPRRGFVTAVAFDPGDPRTVYAAYGGFGGSHLWRSDNRGSSWRAVDRGGGPEALPDVPVHAVVVDPDDGQRLWVGTDLGVFVTVDGGATWAVESTGFATAVTEWLQLLERGGERSLFAFTHGRGAWRVRLQ